MRRFAPFLFFIALIVSVPFSGRAQLVRGEVTQRAAIPWDENRLYFEESPEANSAFDEFAIMDDEKIAFLQQRTKPEILIYHLTDGSFESRIELPLFADAFAYYNGDFYALQRNTLVKIQQNGEIVYRRQMNFGGGLYMPDDLYVDLSGIYVLTADVKTYKVVRDRLEFANDGWRCAHGTIYARKLSLDRLALSGSFNDKRFDAELNVDDLAIGRLATVIPLGLDAEGRLFYAMETEHEGLSHRYLAAFDATTGLNAWSIRVPHIYFARIQKDLLFRNGKVYHSVAARKGVELLEARAGTGNVVPRYPINLRMERYHFNEDRKPARVLPGDEIPVRFETDPRESPKISASCLSKGDMLDTARQYVNAYYYAGHQNVTACADRRNPHCQGKVQGRLICTPPHVYHSLGNAIQGAPYQWGGWSRMNMIINVEEQFLGNWLTYGVSSNAHAWPDDERIVGLDCSGFLSRVWQLDKKHSTRTLPDVCEDLGSAGDASVFGQIREGDAINKPGSHVYFVMALLPTGEVYVSEATTGGGARTRARSIGMTNVADYDVLRFLQTCPETRRLLACENAFPISCGEVHYYNNNGNAATRNVSGYSCSWWQEQGPEVVYELVVDETANYVIELSELESDLDLFLLDDCSPGTCNAFGHNRIETQLKPGAYYLVVDGYNGASGDYRLSVNCETNAPECTEGIALEACNDLYSGRTRDGQNKFDVYACANWREDGPENLHYFTLEETRVVNLRLENAECDLDLFLLADCDPENCIDYGNKEINEELGPGTYYVSVDGYGGVSCAYDLVVSCGDLGRLNVAADPRDKFQLEVYPNPASDELFLNYGPINGAAQIAAHDLTGKRLLELETREEHAKLDLRGFAPGVYILTITDDSVRRSVKFVKR